MILLLQTKELLLLLTKGDIIMWNLLLDTNAFLYLFETVTKKGYTTPTKGIDYDAFKSLTKDNDCFISSVTLFELLFQCIERDKTNWYNQFENYWDFFIEYFHNSPIIINDKNHMPFDIQRFRQFDDNNIMGFFDTKISFETEHLFLFIVALANPIEELYREHFDRKIIGKHYSDFTQANMKRTKSALQNLCIKRYGFEIDDNAEFDKQLNSILFDYVFNLLEYLAESHVIDKPTLEWLINNHTFDTLKLFCSVNEEKVIQGNYEDFTDILDYADKAPIEHIDEEQATLLMLKNSPDYNNFVKYSNKNDKDGIKYINRILAIFEKSENKQIRSSVETAIKNIFDVKPDMNNPLTNLSDGSKAYINYILSSCIKDRRRLSKNDATDYLIATMPDFFNNAKIILDNSKKTVIITFDKNMKNFLLDQNLYYDKKVYDKLVIT